MSNSSGTQQTDLPEKLANPVRNALTAAGILRLEQVATYTEKQLLRLHGVGPKGIEQLRVALTERGLSFAPETGKDG